MYQGKSIGTFKTAEDAARAYKAALLKQWSESIVAAKEGLTAEKEAPGACVLTR
jgi:hypothetical protein